MLDDDRLASTLGLRRTNRIFRAALKTGLAVRNAIRRRRPLKRKPHFIPGAAGSTLYPNGYSPDQIGPDNVPAAAAPTSNDRS